MKIQAAFSIFGGRGRRVFTTFHHLEWGTVNNMFHWNIPLWLIAIFGGLFRAGIVMAIAVPAFGPGLPRWTPWAVIVTCVALCVWAFGRPKSQRS